MKPLKSKISITIDSDLLEQVMNRELSEQLHRTVEQCLTQQEQQIIRLRYGLSGKPPMRQREVAEITGISRSYISRIEKKALLKLRAGYERRQKAAP